MILRKEWSGVAEGVGGGLRREVGLLRCVELFDALVRRS